MPKTLEFIAEHLPRVTVDDVRRFSAAVDIRDARAFAAELQAFVHERLEAVALDVPPELETAEQTLARKAAALRAETRWVPGARGQRLPDWQLDPVKQQLTQAVLQGAAEVDGWTLYRALFEPLEGLDGRSPVDAVTAESVDEVTQAVFNVLGIH